MEESINLTCLHQFHFGHLQQYHIRNSSPLIPAHNTGNVRITRKRKKLEVHTQTLVEHFY